MKRFVCSFIAATAVACFASVAYAQREVVVNFNQFYDHIGGAGNSWSSNFPSEYETGNIIEREVWGFPVTETERALTVGHLTFYNYVSDYGSWRGTGLSTVTDTTNPGLGNDMASIMGTGYLSGVYGVMSGGSDLDLSWNDPMLPVIMFSPGVQLESMRITNTAWTVDSMLIGDQFADPLEANDWNRLIIYGIDADGGYVGEITQHLGGWDSVLGEWWILGNDNNWAFVDLSALVGATELRFAWDSSVLDPDGYGLVYPSYFAFDAITYRTAEPIPEPATLAILGLGLTGLALVRRRRK